MSAFDSSRILRCVKKSTLAGDVRRCLLAKRRVGWQRGQRRGTLDTSRLADLIAGSDDVFKTRPQRVTHHAAVSILVDCSGSMRATRRGAPPCRQLTGETVAPLELAWTAALTLADTLAIPGVAVEVIGFTVVASDSGGIGLVHHPVKTYNQRLSLTSRELTSDLDNLARYSHNNADGENLAIAYADILQRKEPKKIIIQLSDGLPESWVHRGCMEHIPATDHVVDMIQADKRVQLFGVGFSGAEQRQFKQYTFLTDANQISSTLLNLVRQIVD